MNKIKILSKYYTRKLFLLAFSTTAKNTYLIFMGNGFSMVLAFVFTVIIVRLLDYSDIGYFSALWSFLLLVADVSDFGIGSSLSRFLPTIHKKDVFFSFLKTATAVQTVSAAVLTVLIILLSPFISTLIFKDSSFSGYISIIAIGIFGTIMGNFFLFALLARQQFVIGSFFSVSGGLVRVVMLFVVMLFSAVSLYSIVWAQVISLLMFAAIGLFLLGFEFTRYRINMKYVRELLSFSKFLGVARGLTAIAGKLDVIMIIALTNSVEAGIYAIASRVISIYPLLSGSFSTVIAPKIASYHSNPIELKKYMLKATAATGGIIASIIILILIAEPFLVLLFSEKAQPAVSVFQVLLVSMVFFVASLPAVSISLYYLHKPYILTVNSTIQLGIVVLGNIILIPVFGRLGAAYSLVGAYATSLVITSFMAYGEWKRKHA